MQKRIHGYHARLQIPTEQTSPDSLAGWGGRRHLLLTAPSNSSPTLFKTRAARRTTASLGLGDDFVGKTRGRSSVSN